MTGRALRTAPPVTIVSAEAEAAVNYSTAFLLFRLAPPAPWSVSVPPGNLAFYNQTAVDQTRIQVDQFMGGDPATPVFAAHAGTPVRFRLAHPGGIFEGHVFTLHGHGWQERPYTHTENPANPTNDPYAPMAQVIGDNRASEWKGQQISFGPNAHFDIVIEPTEDVPENGAGGTALLGTGHLATRRQPGERAPPPSQAARRQGRPPGPPRRVS